MDQCENSSLTEFYITAFPTTGTVAIFIFVGVLFMYVTAVTGNLIIVTLICMVPQLHTPMYFFLCNLSVVDATYVSTILPKLLSITLTEDKKISFHGCITQLYFYIFCADAEILILTCMAYDRYVAVCTPLHYVQVMRKQVCIAMAACFWLVSAINPLMYALLTSKYSFSSSHQIDHFFCEIRSLLVLSSSNTTSVEMVLFVEDICLVFVTFLFILTSYVSIISAVLKVHSSKGRLKTFSSCSSHLTTVILFYGPIIFLYIKPETEQSKGQDKLLSLLYVAVVPTLNPFVYSLRNKEVIAALPKVIQIKQKT
ncbi:olfactory receptor 5AR1-like [Pyxicephalus adspersus]|uniref:Olfactory receptor n=1 Tax=Pyxicephalus adspersus TaxID=30357 RepID=A0AAV3AU05_PYXAD|nr:TPA: hypothetical protein GDO54_006234 [Pyxicephalus adspersus]